jgi:hypothetical protein
MRKSYYCTVTFITAALLHPRDSPYMRDPRYYCVYIMGSLTGTPYIGISGNLHKRISAQISSPRRIHCALRRGSPVVLGIV